jgi:hypothetical protein
VAALTLSCTESTGVVPHGKTTPVLPTGSDRDASKVAGTYAHPSDKTSQLILLPSGSFTTQYEAGGRSWALGGSFVRADSNLAFSFTGSVWGDFSVGGVVRGDTILLGRSGTLEDQLPLLHYSFVRVRAP